MNFYAYSVPQLRKAMADLHMRHTTIARSIEQLTKYYQEHPGERPNVRLNKYQVTSPNTKLGKNKVICDWLEASSWWILIVTFVPVEVNAMLADMKKAGLKVTLEYLKQFLIDKQIIFCDYQEDKRMYQQDEPQTKNQRKAP